MSETAAVYTARTLGYLGTRDPLSTMEATPTVLADLGRQVAPARAAAKPSPTKWSIQEILAHLADAEIVMGYRVRRILEHSGVAIDAFDQDRWAALGQYNQVPAAESVESFRAQRAGNVRLLRSLSPEQREQFGTHSERGKETIDHICRIWAGHDLNHCQQITALVGRLL
jgi:hypothetical protein